MMLFMYIPFSFFVQLEEWVSESPSGALTSTSGCVLVNFGAPIPKNTKIKSGFTFSYNLSHKNQRTNTAQKHVTTFKKT
jgi:hypothetical protein